ncbi:hypothetical protein O1L60_09755 [Streptomyces diastatochromogenes]|nr:hypothetical protein [Streptomyces diastatochromogenes]
MTPVRATPTALGPAPGGPAVPADASAAVAGSVPPPPRLQARPLARGCRPRGCRAPARRVHGRRVRYVIGSEPGQVNGMRWRRRLARDFTYDA